MSKLRTVLIDDEKNNLDNLDQLLRNYCPVVEVVAKALDANEGKTAVLQHQPDLLFLDIQMPGKNGFDLLRELTAFDFELIFVTAFDQYAIQAIKFAAVDYLMKPISPEELQQAVERAVQKNKHKKQNLQLENLLHLLQHRKETHRIVLTTLEETRFIPTTDILRCESSNNYTIFFLASGEKLMVSKPIYEYEELLKPYGFFRSHQSHLVSFHHVRSWVKKDGGYLLLDDGSRAPVSRNKKEQVIQAMEQWAGRR